MARIVREKISAYLIIYNDWDLLEPALRSVAPIVDELVIVDGAYEWMAAYYRALGVDAERSNSRVYDAVQACGIPYRVVCKVWSSEEEKRIAGYEMCRNRYICRIDADEVLFFDEDALDEFFRGSAAAQVEIPIYVAPGWILARQSGPFAGSGALPRAGFLFDGTRISSRLHLDYLWIATNKGPKNRPFPFQRRPIGFAAHLTQWRTAESAAQRATFYIMNHMRRFGPPSWLPQMRGQQSFDPGTLLNFVSASEISEIILSSKMTSAKLADAEYVRSSPLGPSGERSFADSFARRSASIATLNSRIAASGLHFAKVLPLVIDISTPPSRKPIVRDNALRLEFSELLTSVGAQLYSVGTNEPWSKQRTLASTMDGRRVTVQLPSPGEESVGELLRMQVEVHVTTESKSPVQRFRILCA